jgi:hypothetical protein
MKTEPPDFYNMIATERGAPDGWRWVELNAKGERPHHVFLVRGAVVPLISRGSNKGWPNWKRRDKATEREFVITPVEFDVFIAKWEQDTGCCSRCGGDGQELASCGVNGKTYRNCSRCKATGKAAA